MGKFLRLLVLFMGVLLVGTSCNAYKKPSIPILLSNTKRQKPITILESTEEPTVFLSKYYRHGPRETSGTARYLFLCEHLSSNERLLLAAYQFEVCQVIP